MALIDLASFPNSRIKPRPATRESITDEVVIPANTPTLLRPELDERTVLSVYNKTETGDFRYKRGDSTNIETEGFALGPAKAIDLEGPQSVWVWCDVEAVVTYDDSIG